MVVSLKSAGDEKDERDSARAKWLTVTKPFPLPEISTCSKFHGPPHP